MPKSESSKNWQRNNPDKAGLYKRKFLSNKKQMSVILEQRVIDLIDKVKPVDQPYGAWVRELVEVWAKSQLP